MNTARPSAKKTPNGLSPKTIDTLEMTHPVKKNSKKIPVHSNGNNGHTEPLDIIDTSHLLKVLTAVKNGDFIQCT
jgi:hypothetical protein